MAKGKSKAKTPEAMPSDDKWRVESDARTLRDALEIQGDKGRLGKAAAHAKDQAELHAQVAGLHKRGVISDKALKRMKGAQGAQSPLNVGAAPAAGAAPNGVVAPTGDDAEAAAA